MSFLNQIPTMDRDSLRELKKGIDLSFKDFSRAYGDAIEGFFEPLLSRNLAYLKTNKQKKKQ